MQVTYTMGLFFGEWFFKMVNFGSFLVIFGIFCQKFGYKMAVNGAILTKLDFFEKYDQGLLL